MFADSFHQTVYKKALTLEITDGFNGKTAEAKLIFNRLTNVYTPKILAEYVSSSMFEFKRTGKLCHYEKLTGDFFIYHFSSFQQNRDK